MPGISLKGMKNKKDKNETLDTIVPETSGTMGLRPKFTFLVKRSVLIMKNTLYCKAMDWLKIVYLFLLKVFQPSV
jgi:hypothetical protein